ncbi:hypothetical protein FOZ63_028517, partial [Perkinsus olseni]
VLENCSGCGAEADTNTVFNFTDCILRSCRGPAAVRVAGLSRADISTTRIYECRMGLLVEDTASFALEKSTLTECAQGVLVNGGAFNYHDCRVIKDTTVRLNRHGLMVRGGAIVTVKGGCMICHNCDTTRTNFTDGLQENVMTDIGSGSALHVEYPLPPVTSRGGALVTVLQLDNDGRALVDAFVDGSQARGCCQLFTSPTTATASSNSLSNATSLIAQS